MRKIALILAALAAFWLSAPSAWSQTRNAAQEPGQQQLTEDITRWSRVLDRVQEQLKVKGLPAAALGQLRETVTDVQNQLTAARPALAGAADQIKKLIAALGPPPKEGEQPESVEIAAQRGGLNTQLAEADGRLKQLDLLIQKSRTLLTEISKAESGALGDKLLSRTPSLLSWKTWSTSAAEIAALKVRAGDALSHWYSTPDVSRALSTGYLAGVLAAVFFSAVLGWFVRRWLVRRFGRKREVEQPTFRMRVLAALAEASARTVIPITVAVVAYAGLHAAGLLFDLSRQIALSLLIAVTVFSVLYGVPRAMLSPALPLWRLAALGDYAARLWYRYAQTIAILVAADTLLIFPAAELQPSQELQTTYNFIFGGAYALVFFLIATDQRLWRLPEEEAQHLTPAADARAQDLPQPPHASRSGWWLLARAAIVIVALAIPATALARYGVLSDFISRRMLATAGVFLIALVFHGLARDLVAIFTRDSGKPASGGDQPNAVYVWSVLFLDIGLVLTMAFLIVPLWGGQWNSILDRLGWSFSGFKIGTHVFSVTDVLAGMTAFVIVIAVVRSIQHFVSRRILQYTRVDSGVRDSLNKGIGYAGLVVAVFIGITTAGIDLSGLAIVAGALSVGVGFGLQGVVNNFVSGLILLAERPIKVGDWVAVAGHEGIVKRISVRSTEIKTFSRASVIVPNSELIANPVVNWVHKDRSGRVEIPIGVAYGSDVERVRDTLLRCAVAHEAVSPTPEPHVLFMEFGDNALLFELRFFVANVDQRLSTSSDLRFAIDRAFRAAGISIPFPQLDLHIKETGGLGRQNARKAAPQSRTLGKRKRAASGRQRRQAASPQNGDGDDS